MSSIPNTGSRRVILVGVLVSVVLLGFGLRLYALDSSSLWLDEIFTATASQLDLPSILRFHLDEAANPPLTSLITHLFFLFWGQSEFIARLPSVLFGSLSILLVYEVGEALWNRQVAVAGAFLMAVNAFHVQYSREARYYALMVFLALLSLIFLTRALEKGRWRLWIGFVVCTTLGLYNHYFALLLIPAEVLFGASVIAERWLAKRRDADRVAALRQYSDPSTLAKQTVSFTLSLVMIGISYLPWVPTLQAQFPKQLQSPGLGVTLANLRLSTEFLYSTLIAESGATGVALAFWAAILLWGIWASRRKQKLLSVAWLLTPFFFLAVVDPRHQVRERFVTYTLPLLLLLASRGVLSLTSLLSRVLARVMRGRNPHPAAAQFVVILLFATLGAAPFRDYPAWQKGDWRSATAYLLGNMRTADIIIADGYGYRPGADAAGAVNGLTYYFSLDGRNATIFEAAGGLANQLEQTSDHAATVWGVLWHRDELANVEQIAADFQVTELPKVALIRPLAAQDDLLAEARSLLKTFILLQPMASGRIDLHLALAEIYLKDGHQAEAESQAELALTAARIRQGEGGPEPYLADSYCDLGDLFQQMGKWDDALDAYEEALRIDPAEIGAYEGLGNIYRHFDEPLMAVESYQKALILQPGMAHLYSLLGDAYVEIGRYDDALAAYQEALRIDPAEIGAHQGLGNVYDHLGEPLRALASYNQALILQPNTAHLHFLLGETYLKLGRFQEAVSAYQQALSIEPNHTRAQRRIELLTQALAEDIPSPLVLNLGYQIALLGYSLNPTSSRAGTTVEVTLWWLSEARMDRDYTAFIHLTDADGSPWAQDDSALEHDGHSTSTWGVGQLAKQEYYLELPSDAPPGDYAVQAGVYYWETGERLPAWDEDGQRLPSDTILLDRITIAD
jgi:mannosyltransferase